MKKRKILFIAIGAIIAIIAALALIITYIVKNKKVEVSEMRQIEILIENDSAKAAELIKENIVKITNEIDEETKIIGTGFFHESGYLISNSHIVDIDGKITVEYSDGKTTEGILISNDITSDIALLSVENPQVLAMSFGDTLKLKVTDEVYGIGYAYGLEGEASVTKGILSARRSAGGIEFLQSDASLNSGNSGGPLINAKGELLGINTYATDNASVAMSISSESLEIIINKLIENKKVNYLEDTRSENALSIVLNEIGYKIDDIYGEKDIVDKKFHKHKHDKEENENNTDVTVNNSTSTPTVDYSSKSSDSRLASLTIEGYSVNFNPDTLTYYVVVRNTNETNLNITAVPQESESVVTIKNTTLESGKINTIYVVVLAPNKRNEHTYGINVIKTNDTLEPSRLSKINVFNTLEYVSYKGENCFKIFWNYQDRDGVNIDMQRSNITAIVKNYTVEVYYGSFDNSGNDITTHDKVSRLLKTYSFTGTGLDGEFYIDNDENLREFAYIPISDIRSTLTDEDYENTSFEGKAPITFKVILNTYHQGTIVGYSQNHIGK